MSQAQLTGAASGCAAFALLALFVLVALRRRRDEQPDSDEGYELRSMSTGVLPLASDFHVKDDIYYGGDGIEGERPSSSSLGSDTNNLAMCNPLYADLPPAQEATEVELPHFDNALLLSDADMLELVGDGGHSDLAPVPAGPDADGPHP